MNLWDFARALVGWPGRRDAAEDDGETDRRVRDLARSAEHETERLRRNRGRLAALRAQRRVMTREAGRAEG